MHPRQRLADTCRAESKAYGYTLSIWGAGALLIYHFGTPTPADVFAYVGGGILAFAVLTLLAFGQPFASGADMGSDSEFVAATAIHVLATPGNLGLSYGLIVLFAGLHVAHALVFGIVGLQATLVYNVLLLLEDFVSSAAESVVGAGN